MHEAAGRTEPTTRTRRGALRESFAELHAALAASLQLWAHLHLQPPLRRRLPPEDFVQEVWARAYATFPVYDSARADFRAWLFGIAYNVLREQLRSLRTRGAREADTEVDPADPRTTAGTRAARTEQGRLLLGHADTLTDDERRLLSWRGLEGLPFAEVGRRLGISAVAADSRWRRLCVQLRAAFPAWLEP
jgi:RNA polymerase sigma-70 factor (ECF subfamily)